MKRADILWCTRRRETRIDPLLALSEEQTPEMHEDNAARFYLPMDHSFTSGHLCI